MSFRDEIADKLKRERPSLSASSLKTYVSILYNLKKKLDGEDSLKFFEEDERKTKNLKPAKRLYPPCLCSQANRPITT